MSRESEVLGRHVAAWMLKAQRDLVAVRVDMDVDPPLLDDAVFHCQQAAEKSLKGLLTAHGRPFDKTHSIEALVSDCVEACPPLRPVLDRAVRLSVYAWRYRYPGDALEPPLAEAEEALELAGEVFDTVSEHLDAWAQNLRTSR